MQSPTFLTHLGNTVTIHVASYSDQVTSALVGVESGHSVLENETWNPKCESRHPPFLARNANENPASETSRPLATSSLAVGRFAAKKGSLCSPRGRLVASLSLSLLLLFQGEVAYQNFTVSESLEGEIFQYYSWNADLQRNVDTSVVNVFIHTHWIRCGPLKGAHREDFGLQ